MTAALLVLGLALAQADDPRALVQEGQKLYRERKFADAAARFEKAMALKPAPGLHFNIGRCRQELGQTGKALAAFREYLRLTPSATDRATVEATIAALKDALAKTGVQQLRVVATPEGAQVEVDGKAVGPAPVYVELAPGPHPVSVAAPGFAAQQRTATLALDRFEDLDVALLAAAAVAAAPSPPVVTAAPRAGRRWTWVSLGVGGVSAVAGIGLGLSANGAAAELTSRPHPTAQGNLLVAQARDLALGANVSWGLAATAAVLAVVLFFVENG